MSRSWLIGSNPDCDIVVSRTPVSGHHCRLARGGDSVVLEDLGSAEGTFVNGAAIHAPTPVTPGDAVTLGPATPLPWPAEAIPRGWQIVSIGRAPENQFVVNLPVVSGLHARLIWNEATRMAIVEDLGSGNGTAVGSPDRKASRSVVAATDTVYLGTHPVPASELLALLAPPRPPLLTFRGQEMTIGRDQGCDLVIDSPMVSGRHARLYRAGDATLIEDLGSRNGTSVNGQRIDQAVAVQPGDVIGLGSYLLELRIEQAKTPALEIPGLVTEPASHDRAGERPAPGTPSQSPRRPLAMVLSAAAAVVLIPVVGVLLLGRGSPAPENHGAPKPKSTLAQIDRKTTKKDLDPPVQLRDLPDQVQVPQPNDDNKATPPSVKPDFPAPFPPPPPPPPIVYQPDHLAPEEEAKLGHELHDLIRRYHPEARDTGNLLQRLRAAENPLLARTGRQDRITYTILDSDEVNAFSHVGSHIYVSWGLFTLISSEEELQFVLAHELAHLERRHVFQSLAAEKPGDPSVGTAQRLYHQIAQGYGERQEFEADDRALHLMVQLGHSRRRCLAFLRKYKEYTDDRRFPDGHNPPRSRTVDGPQDVANHFAAHPAAWERLKRLEDLLDRLKPAAKPAPH